MLPALYFSPELYIAFKEQDRAFNFSGTEIRLYFYLMEVWAKLGGKNMFWHTQEQMCEGARCSPNTMKKARKRLHEAGLIEFIAGGKHYGDKTRYTLKFAPRFAANGEELSHGLVTPDGFVIRAKEQGLTLLAKKEGINPDELGINNDATRYQMTPCTTPNFDTLNTSSLPQEKKILLEKENGNLSFQATLFQEARTALPSSEALIEHFSELVQKDTGRETLDHTDRKLVLEIVQKFRAARECADWRNERTQACMVAYWREWATRYFASCKTDTRARILKAEAAEKALKAQTAAEEERKRYIALKQQQDAERQAREAEIFRAQLQREEQRTQHDASIQAALQEKVTTQPLNITYNTHGNTSTTKRYTRHAFANTSASEQPEISYSEYRRRKDAEQAAAAAQAAAA